VKKTLLSVITVTSLVGVSCWLGIAWGQAPAATAAKPVIPHRIGLIDMAFLFSKYEKFEHLREDFKVELDEREQKLKGSMERIKAIQAEAKQFTTGSPEFLDREKQMTQLVANIEAERKTAQMEFGRREAKIYQQIYLEVSDAVEKYAKIYKYSLILRFNRDDLSSDDPQKIVQALQREVIFHQAEDDITDPVLSYLNKTYKGNSTAAPRATPRTGAKSTGASRN
jgi:outer membrane protein